MHRTFATFDLKTLESTPPGRALASSLRAALAESLVSGEIELRGDYGWEFEIRADRYRFNLILQLSDRWLIIIQPIKRFLGVFGTPTASSTLRCAQAVHQALGELGASSLQWFTREEFELSEEGALTPDAAV